MIPMDKHLDKKIAQTFVENAHKPENLQKLIKVFGIDKPEPDQKILDEFNTDTLIEYLYKRVCTGHKFSTGYTMYHHPITDKDEAKKTTDKLVEILSWLCPATTVVVGDKIIVLQNISINTEAKLEQIIKDEL